MSPDIAGVHPHACVDLSALRANIHLMELNRGIRIVESARGCSYNVATTKGDAMKADAIVRARVSEATKLEAAAIFEAAGMTISDAIRMMLIRVVEDRALPFEPVRPNAKTVRAIKAARAGNVKKAKNSKQLLEKLNARD